MIDAKLKEASDLFAELKREYEQPSKSQRWKEVYAKLRVIFIQFPCFLPPAIRKEVAAARGTADVPDDSPQSNAALTLIREALEYVVLLAAREVDMTTFVEASQQLLFFYGHPRTAESERRPMILGLVLLGTLVRDDLVSFATFLEALSENDRASMFVRDIVGLERNLSEGTYTQLVKARNMSPSNDYLPFFDSLTQTVRKRIADGLEAACVRLPVASAASLLLMDGNVEATMALGKERGWTVDGDAFVFKRDSGRKAADPEAAVVEELVFAAELERIV